MVHSSFDYETLTHGTAGPHFYILVEASDGAFSTSPLNNVMLTVTIVDVAEAPVISNLPASISIAENETESQVCQFQDVCDIKIKK